MLPVYSSNIMHANRIHNMRQFSVGMGGRKYVAMHCSNQQRDIPPAVPDDMALSGLRVVLVAPKTEANIGAVARACGNYEVDQLWIVAPRCDPRGSDVDRVACDTVITSRIVIVDSLELALSDTTGSVGFTRRSGAMRYTHSCMGDMLGAFPESIPQLSATIVKPMASSLSSSVPQHSGGILGTTALVFGREESGLTEEELRLVSHACAIPSGRIQPSLNLSHAVAVVLAECYNRRFETIRLHEKALEGAGENRGGRPSFWEHESYLEGPQTLTDSDTSGDIKFATISETEALIGKISAIAEASGVSDTEISQGRAHGRRRLPLGYVRSILSRARITCSEARSLHGFASSVLDRLLPGHPLGSKRSRARGSSGRAQQSDEDISERAE